MEGSTTEGRTAVEQQAALEAAVPGGVVPPGEGNVPPTKAVEGTSTWSLLDRLGLAFCWFLGLLFCAIAVAIVVYLLIQGIHYLKLSQLTTPAASGFSEGESGGFSDAFFGTIILGVLGISMALPIGVAIAVWLVEYGRPKALATFNQDVLRLTAMAFSLAACTTVFEADKVDYKATKKAAPRGGISLFRTRFASRVQRSIWPCWVISRAETFRPDPPGLPLWQDAQY